MSTAGEERSMRIGMLGTGGVGRTLAGAFVGLGHEVALGTRDVRATLARSGTDAMGVGPVKEWLREHPAVHLVTMGEAAAFGELVVLATSGHGALEALAGAGADRLAGKVLIDVTNPLDFSAGFPPTMFVKDSDSLGETIQRAFPGTRVVKTLNTMTARVMVAPDLVGGDSTVFVSGDDEEAKELVEALLRELGWTDILDLGDITTARGPEMYLPLWLRTMGALRTPLFNVRVVRPD